MMIHQNHKSQESKKQFNILKHNKFSNIMEFFLYQNNKEFF